MRNSHRTCEKMQPQNLVHKVHPKQTYRRTRQLALELLNKYACVPVQAERRWEGR